MEKLSRILMFLLLAVISFVLVVVAIGFILGDSSPLQWGIDIRRHVIKFSVIVFLFAILFVENE